MSADIRNYGGWRERRGFGLAGLSGRQTAAALGAVLVLLAVALVRPGFVGVLGIPLGLGSGWSCCGFATKRSFRGSDAMVPGC